MRRTALPLLLLVAACTGGPGSSSTDPGTPTVVPPTKTTTDPIVGDGEIAGTPDESGASDGAAMVPSAGTSAGAAAGSSSGSSGSSGAVGSSSSGSSSSGGSPTGSSSGFVSTGSDNGYTSILTAGAWDDNRNFSFFAGYRASLLQTPNDGYLGISDAETQAAKALFGSTQTAKTTLDVSLMIDTTGSMGDEIAYLQNEFTALSKTIESKYPGAAQHWSLVLYKDKHDPYIVKWFDFRADANEFQQKLMVAESSGGGDFPESPERALDVADRLSWRQDASTARLLFWVADAPHHNEDTAAMTAAVKAAAAKNIHVYPVAASGVDAFTEYTMRSTAQLTGGRYLFLTDDSGVGDSHEVPILPCYFVTKLDQAILRMVDVELSGAYREPTQDEIIRTAGDPKNSVCVADGGQQVQIY